MRQPEIVNTAGANGNTRVLAGNMVVDIQGDLLSRNDTAKSVVCLN